MRRLSAQEIAELDDNSGPVGKYAPYGESVVIIEADDSDERSRRYELRVKGVTGTFCAEYFSVDVTETVPGSCLIQWSVRMPNGQTSSLGRTAGHRPAGPADSPVRVPARRRHRHRLGRDVP